MSHKNLKVTIRLEGMEGLLESLASPDAKAAREQHLRDHALLSTREVGTLSSDGNQVSIPDKFGLNRWEPVKPYDPEAGQSAPTFEPVTETPEERFAREDREYFDLVGKKVRIVEPLEPKGATGVIHGYTPERSIYKARFNITLNVDGKPQERTYIRDAFEVVADV